MAMNLRYNDMVIKDGKAVLIKELSAEEQNLVENSQQTAKCEKKSQQLAEKSLSTKPKNNPKHNPLIKSLQKMKADNYNVKSRSRVID